MVKLQQLKDLLIVFKEMQMMYSPTRPEDLDTTLEDHVADEVRYMCMSRPVRPVVKEDAAVQWTDPLNQVNRG